MTLRNVRYRVARTPSGKKVRLAISKKTGTVREAKLLPKRRKRR